MSKMFMGSIDLNKIDKNRIVKFDKNGNRFENKAQYLSVVIWLNDELDQYGNIGSIQESITKEESDKGVKATYLGNFKNKPGQDVSKTDSEKTESKKTAYQEHEDDLPF